MRYYLAYFVYVCMPATCFLFVRESEQVCNFPEKTMHFPLSHKCLSMKNSSAVWKMDEENHFALLQDKLRKQLSIAFTKKKKKNSCLYTCISIRFPGNSIAFTKKKKILLPLRLYQYILCRETSKNTASMPEMRSLHTVQQDFLETHIQEETMSGLITYTLFSL